MKKLLLLLLVIVALAATAAVSHVSSAFAAKKPTPNMLCGNCGDNGDPYSLYNGFIWVRCNGDGHGGNYQIGDHTDAWGARWTCTSSGWVAG